MNAERMRCRAARLPAQKDERGHWQPFSENPQLPAAAAASCQPLQPPAASTREECSPAEQGEEDESAHHFVLSVLREGGAGREARGGEKAGRLAPPHVCRHAVGCTGAVSSSAHANSKLHQVQAAAAYARPSNQRGGDRMPYDHGSEIRTSMGDRRKGSGDKGLWRESQPKMNDQAEPACSFMLGVGGGTTLSRHPSVPAPAPFRLS